MKRPSFQFYPGDWRGTRWVLFDPSVSFGVPILPACYAVYLDGDMRYVGQTMNLRKRLQNQRLVCSVTAGAIKALGETLKRSLSRPDLEANLVTGLCVKCG